MTDTTDIRSQLIALARGPHILTDVGGVPVDSRRLRRVLAALPRRCTWTATVEGATLRIRFGAGAEPHRGGYTAKAVLPPLPPAVAAALMAAQKGRARCGALRKEERTALARWLGLRARDIQRLSGAELAELVAERRLR